MQLEVIGVGGGGCRLAAAIRAWEADTPQSFVLDTFAFDTDTDTLASLPETVPEDNRYRYGDGVNHGLNGNLQRGLELGTEHVDELERQLDAGNPSIADGFLVAIGLGGATGGGTAPALVSSLKRLYDAPVYVLATLPAACELEERDDSLVVEDVVADAADTSDSPATAAADQRGAASESAAEASDTKDTAGSAVAASNDGDTATDGITIAETRPLADENATQTLAQLEGLADAIICFDNEAWLKTGESLADGRVRLNEAFATRVGKFFAATGDAGEGRAQPATTPEAETIIDANDVARILGSRSSIVSIGYGTQQVDAPGGGSLLGLGFGPDIGPQLFAEDEAVETAAAYSAVETVIQKALYGKHTLECEAADADRALVIVGGPPAWLNRQAITDGRRTVESATETDELLGGDAPRPDGDSVFALVAFAGDTLRERLEERTASISSD
ncbi:cell division protein FtsZ [Natronolimnobius sp. AArcel1]|uniref:cell division protein FtsZ n=1 Tax=Natronolimnobius sp. AArcel1 TaxID=1679093 RepID=UPI0013EA6E89|nr:cell division protein FtsZ [Natronolimnobius sp. AArcel1]NGM68932.1 cell division protein FtsZ [Natronolimnobius sp. AArcel1]